MPLHGKKGKASPKRKTGQKGKRNQLSSTKKSKSSVGSTGVNELLATVDELLVSFEYEEALSCCERGIAAHPTSGQLLETAGAIHLELGHVDQAYDCLTRAVQQSPDNGHSKYMYLGQLCQGEEAVQFFLKGIEILERTISEVQKKGGSIEEEDISTEDVSNGYCAIAEIYLTDSCENPEAEDKCGYFCQKAIEACESNPDAFSLKASYLLSLKKTDEAKETVLTGLSLWRVVSKAAKGETTQPPPYGSRMSCAKILLEVGEYEKAFSVLEGLLKDDDEVVQVWYLMGWLHVLTEDKDSASFYLLQAKTLYSSGGSDNDDLLEHIEELLKELPSAKELECEGEESGREDDDNEDISDVDSCVESDIDQESRTNTEGMDMS